MASTGWIYQWRENARKSSLSSGGNVAEKTVEVKALKFLAVAGRAFQVAGGPVREPGSTGNPLRERAFR